jgi:hypothetical protein
MGGLTETHRVNLSTAVAGNRLMIICQCSNTARNCRRRVKIRSVPPKPPATPMLLAQRVAVVDFDIPFWSVLKIMFKWMAAAFVVFCCFLPAIILVWLIIMGVFAGLINGVMSSLHHP